MKQLRIWHILVFGLAAQITLGCEGTNIVFNPVDHPREATDWQCLQDYHCPLPEGGCVTVTCEGEPGLCVYETDCECACNNRCGEVGEGTCDCGGCTECGEECVDNSCVFTACDDIECGDDGCGGSCGTCTDPEQCVEGICEIVSWCGDGVCDVAEGENCDTCADDCGCGCGEECIDSECIFTACDDIECGPDGCGGSCGECIIPPEVTAYPAPDDVEVPLAVVVNLTSTVAFDPGTLDFSLACDGAPVTGRPEFTEGDEVFFFFPDALLPPDVECEVTFTFGGEPWSYVFGTVVDAGVIPFSGNTNLADGEAVSFRITIDEVPHPVDYGPAIVAAMSDSPNLVAPVRIDEGVDGVHPMLYVYQDPTDFDEDGYFEVNFTSVPYRLMGEINGIHFMASGPLTLFRSPSEASPGGEAPVDFVYFGGTLAADGDGNPIIDAGWSGGYVSDCDPLIDLYPDVDVFLEPLCGDSNDLFGYANYTGEYNDIEDVVFTLFDATPEQISVDFAPPMEARYAHVLRWQPLVEIYQDGILIHTSEDYPDGIEEYPDFVELEERWYTFTSWSYYLPTDQPLDPGTYLLRLALGLYGFETELTIE